MMSGLSPTRYLIFHALSCIRSKLKFILTQSNFRITLAARSALNLYECAVSAALI
jgi:hypothetical protein